MEGILLVLFSSLGQEFYNGVATYLIGKIRKPNWKVHRCIDELKKTHLFDNN